MQRDDVVDRMFLDGGEDAVDVPPCVNAGGGGVVRGGDGGGEVADVVVHGVNDKDVVAGTLELAGEVDGDGEAAVGEEDVQGTNIGGRAETADG